VGGVKEREGGGGSRGRGLGGRAAGVGAARDTGGGHDCLVRSCIGLLFCCSLCFLREGGSSRRKERERRKEKKEKRRKEKKKKNMEIFLNLKISEK
jgi:hypothetical protein